MLKSQPTPLRHLPRSLLGEGPIWDYRTGTLYWVDINGGWLHAYRPRDGYTKSIRVGPFPSCVALNEDGNLVVTLKDRVVLLDPERGSILRVLATVDEGADNRFNDCRCDPAGRLLAGTMNMPMPRKPTASLYVLDLDLKVRRLLGGVTVSNGLTWSLDGSTLYYIDTPTRRIAVYSYDVKDGSITGVKGYIDLSAVQGNPDGMTIDSEGYLWVAMWGGGRVIRVEASSGKVVYTISADARYTSSCTFGGGDLSTLFISTAMGEAPLENEGYLYRVDVGVRGVRQNLCKY